MVFKKSAGVLSQRIEKPAQGGKALTMGRMGVCHCCNIRAGGMDLRVNGECGFIDGPVAFHNISCPVDQDQIADAEEAEVQTKRVDPELIGGLWISDTDVSGDAFAVT